MDIEPAIATDIAAQPNTPSGLSGHLPRGTGEENTSQSSALLPRPTGELTAKQAEGVLKPQPNTPTGLSGHLPRGTGEEKSYDFSASFLTRESCRYA
jgi:hypothetical protein